MSLTIGQLHLRRSNFINASPQRIWQEFENFERLKAWFGIGHQLLKFEPQPGSEVTLSVEIGGQTHRFGGKLLVFSPQQELSFENNWHGEQAWPVPTYITIRLTAVYGGTSVELFHHGFERLGAQAADCLQDYELGWTINHLHALRNIVEN